MDEEVIRMGEYCDKCGKKDAEVKIISIRYIEVNTDKATTDKKYVEDDPHLCKNCYKKFLEELETLIYNTFGYV